MSRASSFILRWVLTVEARLCLCYRSSLDLARALMNRIIEVEIAVSQNVVFALHVN